MRFRIVVVGLGVLIGVAVTAAVGGAAPATTFKVASTLDGKTVLPHLIRWRGLPTLPQGQVKEVDFVIDGRVAWIEHQAPYVFSDDGFLVTSFLTPGKHRFTVRVVARDGRRAIDTVIARVLPAPMPPAALLGTWERTIPDTSNAPRPGSAGNPTDTLTPPGTYRVTFDRRWILDVFPCTTSPCRFVEKNGAGGEFASDWTPGSRTFRVRGAVTFSVFHDTDRLAGSWCYRWGPAATYTWSVVGDVLTLAPADGRDNCVVRGFVWSGTWKKVR
jgi:hypothetical protein